MSSKSIFSDMSFSVMLKNALSHPGINEKTKLSLDFVEYNTRSLSEIMNTWNGRDKLLAIIQYSWGVYVQALKKTHPMEENLKSKSYLQCKRIQSNLSSGRKVFRLLKFSDEISNVIKHARAPNNKNFLQELMFYSSGVWAIIYYFTDNVIWLSAKKYKPLSKIKDLFSMGRCLIEICKSVYELSNDLKKEEIILKKLGLYDDCFIAETEESYMLIKDLITLRRQMSFYVLELIVNVLRVFMLYKSLKFLGSVYIDTIFVELCGVFSSFFALLKSVKKKSYEKKQLKKSQEKNKKPKRVEFYEEEKKSKDLFNLNNIELSVDDSDADNEKMNNQIQGYAQINKVKSSVSSTHDITESNKSNTKLKHAKSTVNVHAGGMLGDRKNNQS